MGTKLTSWKRESGLPEDGLEAWRQVYPRRPVRPVTTADGAELFLGSELSDKTVLGQMVVGRLRFPAFDPPLSGASLPYDPAPERRHFPRMAISVFDLFTIGIGPSSSHTVGPMRAARRFVERLEREGGWASCARIEATLYGSLALTGKGHGTDRAVLMGLYGETPGGGRSRRDRSRVAAIRETLRLRPLRGRREIPFDEKTDLIFNRREVLPLHSNGMRFTALRRRGAILEERIYYSVGGGFVVDEQSAGETGWSRTRRRSRIRSSPARSCCAFPASTNSRSGS